MARDLNYSGAFLGWKKSLNFEDIKMYRADKFKQIKNCKKIATKKFAINFNIFFFYEIILGAVTVNIE